MKLTIGNRNYSSWSLRGWLAAKQSGLPFEEEVVPLDFAGASHRAHPSLAPSHGKVPVLWDGDVVVWGGPARLAFHGVAPLQPGDHPAAGALRYNLTFRKTR